MSFLGPIIIIPGSRSDHHVRPHVGKGYEPSWFGPVRDTKAPEYPRCSRHDLVMPIHSARPTRDPWAQANDRH